MLTQRQSRFVEEFVARPNGTQAAIRAGYSPHTARAIACENLQKPEIADAIKRRSAARTRKAEVEQQRVLTKLMNIASANIQDILNPDGTLKEPAEWSEAARDGFQLVLRKQAVRGRKSSKSKQDGMRIEIRSRNSLKALNLLAKHLGMFPTKTRRS